MSNNLSMHSFVDIENYSNRLHINTVLTLITNGAAIYLILRHSSKAMGTYKYYILFTIVTAFIMDFHTTVIYGPYPLFPIPAFCSAGIFKSFGWFWGETVHYIIMHVTLSFAGLSILVGLLYQHFSLANNASFFHSRKGAIIIFFVTLAYPIPALTLFFLAGYDNDIFNKEIKTNYPSLYKFVTVEACNGIPMNGFTVAYLIDAIIQVLIIFLLFIYVCYRIHRRWSKLKHTMSANTRKIKKQYLLTLLIQMTVPFIFIVIPCVGLMIAVILKVENIKELSQFGIQILALHSCCNALTIMIVIKPYQQQLKKYSKNLIFWKKHAHITVESISSTKRKSVFSNNQISNVRVTNLSSSHF